MKFLVDAQLPPALARYLTEMGHDAQHVADVGLLSAPDAIIWDWARENQTVLITKDSDFPDRRSRGDLTVPIVWVRLGNASRLALIATFAPYLPRILAWLELGETLIEIR